MLFLVDCKYSDLSGKYVYAVCTDENSGSKGYSSALINEAKKIHERFFYGLFLLMILCLIFMRSSVLKQSFTPIKILKIKLFFEESNEIIEYLYSGSDYTYPDGMVYSIKDFPVGSTGKINK